VRFFCARPETGSGALKGRDTNKVARTIHRLDKTAMSRIGFGVIWDGDG
jgi:hypothetical protein